MHDLPQNKETMGSNSAQWRRQLALSSPQSDTYLQTLKCLCFHQDGYEGGVQTEEEEQFFCTSQNLMKTRKTRRVGNERNASSDGACNVHAFLLFCALYRVMSLLCCPNCLDSRLTEVVSMKLLSRLRTNPGNPVDVRNRVSRMLSSRTSPLIWDSKCSELTVFHLRRGFCATNVFDRRVDVRKGIPNLLMMLFRNIALEKV